MTPAIGSASAPTQGFGAALAQQPQPGGQAGQAAPSGDSAAMTGMGMDAMSSQINQTLSRIRNIGVAIAPLRDLVPQADDEIAQIEELLKAIVVKASAGGPMMNGSAAQIPGNGGGA